MIWPEGNEMIPYSNHLAVLSLCSSLQSRCSLRTGLISLRISFVNVSSFRAADGINWMCFNEFTVAGLMGGDRADTGWHFKQAIPPFCGLKTAVPCAV